MPAFSNPVSGRIYAKGEAHPGGAFYVTATFADHVASGRGPGIDIGYGGCGAPVVAMKAGVVSYIRVGTVGATTSDKASIVRVKHANGYESGYAHLKIRLGLSVGQIVGEGYQLGNIDKIGSWACHLHGGMKDPAGVEIDWWPLLAQNGAVEDTEVISAPITERIVNRRGPIPSNAKFRPEPTTANTELRIIPAGSVFDPDYAVTGQAVAGTTRWLTGMYEVGGKQTRGYLHESVVNPLKPIEQVGHSDAELAAAAKLARANGISDAAKAAGAVV